ncbi:DUF418 domain-containing protein [Mariniflexile sp.]|uniref:DUF418 domain-containing protein n=1 Tax=Mariniflexile sp. TaxID=1979402 RepID=UPI00404896F3
MNTTTNQIKPTQINERIDFLDVLRGLAIQFIFMANIVTFSGIFFFEETFRNPNAVWASDNAVDFITFTLIDGKFYSIFSLLFGIGCMVQYQKLKKSNKPFAPFFKRRMFWLLIFGLVHLVGFWLGDILTLYALLGFLLLFFVDTADKKLLRFAAVLIMLPLLNWFIIDFLKLDYSQFFFQKSLDVWSYFGFPSAEWNGRTFNDMQFYFNNGNWADFFKMNIGNAFVRAGFILEEGRVFKVFGIFLIGLWAGRKILNNALLKNIKFLKKVALIGIGIGLPMSIVRTYFVFFGGNTDFIGFINTLNYAFSTVPLALGYAALLAVIYHKKPALLHWLAPAGKMAFTNYIMQTLISITIFYKLGFGLAGKFGFTVITLIAISIFLLQVLFSTFWLKHFRFGPLEWLWRQLTYNKKIEINKYREEKLGTRNLEHETINQKL